MSVGMNAQTGKLMPRAEHVKQSMQVILSTRLNSLPNQRDFGSELPDLIDAPQNPYTLGQFNRATVLALITWEPRKEILSASLVPDVDGKLQIETIGYDR